MAICKYCKREMLKAKGCKEILVPVKGKGYVAPIKMGDPRDMAYFYGLTRCGDCGARAGFYHHPGCDMETCPECGGQLLGCECVYSIDVTMSDTELNTKLHNAKDNLRQNRNSLDRLELFCLTSDIEEMEQLIKDRKNGLFESEEEK